MIQKIAKSGVLTLLLMGTLQAENVHYSDAFYGGIDGGFLSFGGDSLHIETVVNDKSQNKQTFSDISGAPITLSAGYQHFNGNRIEIYAKYDDIDTDGGTISTNTYGINYQFGFASLSDGGKLMPYLLIGAGTGTADAKKFKKIDNADIVEVNLGVGIHYQFSEAIYGSFSYLNNTMIFDNVKDSKSNTLDISDLTSNTLHVGVEYHF